ncbi:unnamed protein product, partial [Musa acuminata var. zebrina]
SVCLPLPPFCFLAVAPPLEMGRRSFSSALASSFVVTTLRRRRHLGGLRRRSSIKGFIVLR